MINYLLHCSGLFRSFTVAILLTFSSFVQAQTSALIPGTPLCIQDEFNYNWQAAANMEADGTIRLRGTVFISGMDWAFTGFYSPSNKEIQLNADNPLSNDCALTSGAIHYIGVRTPAGLSGNWTNDCGGFGSWSGQMYRGSCSSTLKTPLNQEHPAQSPSGMQNSELYISPNPVENYTRITYEMPTAGFLKIEVMDMQGISRRILFEGQSQGGQLELNWDGLSQNGIRLAAGNYIIRANNTAYVVQLR